MVFLVSSKDELQVSSSGTLAGDFLAPVMRRFWKERHQSIIYNDVRSAVVDEVAFQAAAASGTSSSQPENPEAAMIQPCKNVQFFIRGVSGVQTQVVRGWHDALGQVAGVKGLDVYAMVGGKIVDHASSLYCSELHCDLFVTVFVVGPVRMCLGSGRV